MVSDEDYSQLADKLLAKDDDNRAAGRAPLLRLEQEGGRAAVIDLLKRVHAAAPKRPVSLTEQENRIFSSGVTYPSRRNFLIAGGLAATGFGLNVAASKVRNYAKQADGKEHAFLNPVATTMEQAAFGASFTITPTLGLAIKQYLENKDDRDEPIDYIRDHLNIIMDIPEQRSVSHAAR